MTPHSTNAGPLCGPPLGREQIVERARSWLRPWVPFSDTASHTTRFGTYRAHGFGYLSMAWGLPADLPPQVGALTAIGFDITKAELLAGDVLLRTDGSALTRHVVIFDRWADDDHFAYWGFEQSRLHGTTHRTIRYPYDEKTSKYRPYRYRNACGPSTAR